MRCSVLLASVLLGSASPIVAQPFGFTHSMFPADQDPSQAVAFGDVDGDGDLDAFVGNGDPFDLGFGPPARQDRLYRNDGSGVFRDVTTTSLPALLNRTNAIALGDLDGDGDLDAFLGGGTAGIVTLPDTSRFYRNDGSGVFTSIAILPSVTYSIALGDVDGDGDLDAFLGTAWSSVFLGPTLGPNRLFLNGGTGTFTDASATNVPIPGGPPTIASSQSVALGDVDGDGDLDAFAAYGAQDRLLVNSGAGFFADAGATNLPALADDTRAVALGDLDGDGDLDAFLGNGGPDRLYQNNGTGLFTDSSASLPSVADPTWAVSLGDVDGDGDLDALTGNVGLERLYLNGGAGVFADATASALPALLDDDTQSVALGDVDGDGDLDALTGNLRQQDRLLLNDGAGDFTLAGGGDLPGRADNTWGVALGDVDGDGDLDALLGNEGMCGPVAGCTGGQNRLYLNDGTGVLTDVTTTNLPAVLDWAHAVAFGDVDADGDLDAFVGNFVYPGTNRLLLNGSAGTFTDATLTHMPILPALTNSIALGDVDGDGDIDAFIGSEFENYPAYSQSRLYLNSGAGVFADATAANLPSAFVGDTKSVALGDVDGDGDLDAYLGVEPDDFSGSRLYRNDGAGAFTDVSATNLPVLFFSSTRALALGDVDGDGDLDAFLRKVGGDQLFKNDGTGAFLTIAWTVPPNPGEEGRAVALGDADGDGDLDAFKGNSGPYDGVLNRLFLNDGTGLFTDVTATTFPTLSTETRAIALGDMDGDGDLDAVAAVDGADRVYVNLSRQVSWRGLPRAGKPFALDVRGPANGLWGIGASPGTAAIPLPPLGTLRLDPGLFFHVGAGALDSTGRGSLGFPVPAIPALVGASLNYQAVVGFPLRLTNLERTTVTDL